MALIDTVKKIAEQTGSVNAPAAFFFGVVTGASPLTIRVDNRFDISGEDIVVPRELTDYQTQLSFDNPSIKQVSTNWDMAEQLESDPYKLDFKEKTKHDVTIYEALKGGEKVILIRNQGGQQFLVVGRLV